MPTIFKPMHVTTDANTLFQDDGFMAIVPIDPGLGADAAAVLPPPPAPQWLLVGEGGQVQASGNAAPATSPASATVSSPSHTTGGLVFNFTYDASVASAPAAFKSALAAAAQYLQGQFSDAVTLNVAIGYGEVGGHTMGSGALGSSMSYLSSYTYAQISAALRADASSSLDAAAVASLGATSPTGGTMWVTSGEAKALGLSSGTGADGFVGFSAGNAFDYNNTDGVNGGTYDFFGVALHELSEVMGRMLLIGGSIGGTTNSFAAMDMFHYAAAGTIDRTQSQPGYFSVDAGKTNLGTFNTISGGDAGDWGGGMGADAFNAFSSGGVANTVSSADLAALDAIGWNRSGATPPAPATPPTIKIALTTDTGISSTDHVTSRAGLTGTAPAGAIITLMDGAVKLGTATTNAAGTWSFAPALSVQGIHTIQASATVAGATGTATLAIVYDTVAPVVTLSMPHDTGVSATDRITSNPTIGGNVDPGAVVTLMKGATLLGTVTADGTGAWSFTPTGLSQGASTIVATVTDQAGNIGSATIGLTLDTVAPAVTLTRASATTAALKGTTEASRTVTITEAGRTLGSAVANSAGAWVFTPTGLAPGAHTLLASSADAAGNIGTATLGFTFNPQLPSGVSLAPVGGALAPASTLATSLPGAMRLASVAQLGGMAGDGFGFALGGAAAARFALVTAGGGATLQVAAAPLPAGVYALTVTPGDTTLGLAGTATAFDVVVGAIGADTVNLAGQVGSATPTFVFGLAGADAIDASAMQAHVWIDGGAAADALRLGTGGTTLLYGAASDSTQAATDVISGFNPARDLIDLSGLNRVFTIAGNLTGTTLASGAVGWQQVGGNTFLYANTSTKAEALGATDMRIELLGQITLATANIQHL